MSQKFYKGRTNNHLTWVMVDATDFATPESALSAATTIKIYGKLRSGTGVNFVSSGTGSLTNDIVHVGASATGIYTIALAKADLSDASAAWYDQYIITLSGTGAARQTLIVDGGIDDSYVSNVVSYLSNIVSYLSNFASNVSGVVSDIRSGTSDTNSKLVVMSGILSDTYSGIVALSDAISDLGSDLRSYIGAGVPLDASTMSDLRSAISAGPAGVVTASDISDIASAVWATALATKLVQLNTSDLSDLRSAIAAGPTTAVTASDISDIASAVWAAKYTAHSAASSFGSLFSDVYSRLLLNQSRISDIASYLVVMSGVLSDTYSGVSELTSRVTATVASASDVASKVWAEKYTAASNVKASTFGSALRLNMSRISDTQSYLVAMSGMLSDAHSAAILAASNASDAYSAALLTQSMVSDVDSALTSQFAVTSSNISDAHSAAILAASYASDVYSALTDVRAEPGQATPAASLAALAKLDYLYKAWRNRTTQTATQYSLYGDDATTIHQKATFADDGVTADRGEVATGP